MRDMDMARYYPAIMREVREFKYLSQAENSELMALWQGLQNISNDQFIRDTTVSGVSRYERMLKIKPPASDTLDERKFRLLARYNEDLPYTVLNLRNQLAHLCGANGYRLNIINDSFTIIAKVELVAKRNLETVRELLERMVPMNMIIDLGLMYNQHKTFRPYTHGQLQQISYTAMRNEVIEA